MFVVPCTIVVLAALSITVSTAAVAQQLSPKARPSVRVNKTVDNAVRTPITGSHPGIVDQAKIGARLTSSTRLGNLHLVLAPSDDQAAAFRAFTDGQQDKMSPNYHKWLTPDAFGQYFGASSEDIAKVTAWLGDHGLQVTNVAKSNRVITFAGTSDRIESAFQTELHHVTLPNGEAHIANTTDISIPAALSSVVRGVARLNDIYPTPGMHKVGTVAARQAAADEAPMLVLGGTIKTPLFGAATGTHYVAPGDVATIYNTTPLTAAGIDGTGTTIAIIAQSNISLADVQQFRSMFGLPKNDPSIIVVGGDPGQNGDVGEAYLDAEWGGALATGAKVDFLVSAPNLEDGGIDTSAMYAVENNIGDIISMSYGGCETNNGAAGTAFWNTLWEQAAAQGQTVFVSTGDSSAAGCDSSNATYASGGYGVNALGSSAYNVAVGGSTFIDYGQSTYWGNNGTTSPFTNALSYIPEAPWNNSKIATANGTYLNGSSTGTIAGSGIGGTGGGISIYTARPSWQTGSGISSTTDPSCTTGTGSTCYAAGTSGTAPISGLHRLVPDVVNISANNHDGALYCSDSVCSVSSTGALVDAGIVGGTSVATPVQASLQALINQKNGGRQGNANFYYYPLAQAQYSASTTACQSKLGTASSPTVTLPASTCNFHDIVAGSNAVPTSNSDTTGIGFNAAVGYDPASGLGSMNVANVANNWHTVNFTATTTTLAISPAEGIQHGANQTINVTVVPTSGSGTPTGDFALIAETTTPDGPFQYKLSSGSFSGLVSSGANYSTTVGSIVGSVAALPAGSYNIYAQYAGDGTFGGSISNLVPVVIAKDTSAVQLNPYNITAGGPVNQQSSFAYGADVFIDSFVYPSASGAGIPTGALSYTLTRNGVAMPPLTANLDATGNTYFYSGQALPNFYLKPNYTAPLSPGSYVLTGSYPGDSNFGSSTGTVSFTVTQATPAVTFTGPTQITPAESVTYSFSIASLASATYPNSAATATGTVTFTAGATYLGTCTLTAGACSFSTRGITTAGANTVAAVYGGDTNYAATSKSLTVTVGSLAAPTITITTTGTLTFGNTIYFVATLNPTAATGTVNFLVNGAPFGSASLSSGVATLKPTAGTVPAGTVSITAVYNGSSSYASNTQTTSFTIAKLAKSLLLSGPTSSTYGQNITAGLDLYSAAVTSTSFIAPTGTITLTDNGNTLGTTSTFSYGQDQEQYVSSFSTSTLPAGTHTISASYSGDNNYAAVAAPVANFTVAIAKLTPTLTLSTSTGATSFATGSTVNLQVFIPASSAMAMPTGTVTLTDTTTAATYTASAFTYSASVGGFIVTASVGGLSGTHTYTVSLSADTNYAAATSNALTVLVETNNVWVANGNGTVSALSQSGTAVTGSGVPGGGTAIAIDNSGNVWSASNTGNSVTKFSNAGAASGTYTSTISAPTALAIDGSGIVWITNGGTSNTLTGVTSTGAAVAPAAFQTGFSNPTSIHVDGSGNLWVTNAGDNSVSETIGVATPVITPQVTAVQNATPAAKP